MHLFGILDVEHIEFDLIEFELELDLTDFDECHRPFSLSSTKLLNMLNGVFQILFVLIFILLDFSFLSLLFGMNTKKEIERKKFHYCLI